MDEAVYKVAQTLIQIMMLRLYLEAQNILPSRYVLILYAHFSNNNGSTGENNVFNFSYTPVQKSYSKFILLTIENNDWKRIQYDSTGQFCSRHGDYINKKLSAVMTLFRRRLPYR